jgi:hypothetical protein
MTAAGDIAATTAKHLLGNAWLATVSGLKFID